MNADLTVNGGVVNSGTVTIPEGVTLTVDGGTFENLGTVNGDGTIALLNGATLEGPGTVDVAGFSQVGSLEVQGAVDLSGRRKPSIWTFSHPRCSTR